MAIQYIDNQPIQIYKVAPSDDELALGMTAWAQTAYHKRNGNCGFIGPDYCHPVLNTDIMTFQFKLTEVGDELFQDFFETSLAFGTTTSTSASHLVDSGANFVSAGVLANQMVFNDTDNTNTTVVNVDSGTDIELNEDIFVSGEDYYISPLVKYGSWNYSMVTGIASKSTIGTGSFDASGILAIDSIYKVTISITDITAGSLQIKLGDTVAATLGSVGIHTVYGRCEGVTDFQIVNSTAFIGSFDLDGVEIYALENEYSIAIFDLDNNYVNSFVWDATVNDAYTIGNCSVSKAWNTLDLECGSYVIGVYEGNLSSCEELILNGDFASPVGWATDPGISIGGGQANFDTVSAGNALTNTLQCGIQNGKSYTLTYSIGNFMGSKTGVYELNVPAILTPRDSSAELGIQTVNFTAVSDQSFMAFVATETCTFTLDNVSLVCNDCEILPEEADGLSECYCVCDSHECTVLLKYKNDSNGFGLFYDDNSDYNYFRLEASLLSSPIKDNELIQFKNTLHFMNIPYWDGMKVFTLATDLLPAWVHNTLTAALKHRILLIDGVRYIGIEEHAYNEEQTEVFGAATRVALWNQRNLNNLY